MELLENFDFISLDFALEIGMLLTFPVLFLKFHLFLWFGHISFSTREEISGFHGFLWNIPDILPKPSHQANSETKDELFNPS